MFLFNGKEREREWRALHVKFSADKVGLIVLSTAWLKTQASVDSAVRCAVAGGRLAARTIVSLVADLCAIVTVFSF